MLLDLLLLDISLLLGLTYPIFLHLLYLSFLPLLYLLIYHLFSIVSIFIFYYYWLFCYYCLSVLFATDLSIFSTSIPYVSFIYIYKWLFRYFFLFTNLKTMQFTWEKPEIEENISIKRVCFHYFVLFYQKPIFYHPLSF